MHGGKLQQYGTPDDVYRRPANKIVADFMGIVNFVPGTARGGDVVEIDGVGMRSPRALGLAAGAPVDVAVRPENVRLFRAPTEEARLAGTITEKTYLGNIIEYWVELKSGAVLRAQTHPLEQFAPGDEVHLTIDGAECSVFPRTDAATRH
jgi:iron(III) transport system ATP-binding protein